MDWSTVETEVFDKISGWVTSAATMFPNLVVALVVMAITFLAARAASSLARSGLKRVTSNTQLVDLAARVLFLLVVAAGLMIALGVLQLSQTVSSLLAGFGILGVAFGFALQDITANFMSGVMMAVRHPVAVGDLVETNGYLGRVTELNLRATRLETFTGEHVYIPNKDVWGQVLTNYTESPRRRLDVACGVSYGDDLDKAEQLVQEAIEGTPHRDPNAAPKVIWQGFGGSSIDFIAVVWLLKSDQGSYLEAQSSVVKAIKVAFADGGITIPFPIRTLDFGILGGERLDEVLARRDAPAAEPT